MKVTRRVSILHIIPSIIALLAYSLPSYSQNDSTELYKYYDDLNVLEQTIYEKYYYQRPKFIFLKQPPIKRSDEGKKPPFEDMKPNGYVSNYSLYTDTNNPFDYQVEQYDKYGDSTRQYLLSNRYSMPLDEYLANRKEQIQSKLWDSIISTYDMKKAMSRSDLAMLLGQSTGLSIPLPPNPVLNIFGKPELAINVNGSVNVKIGWQWNIQNLSTASATGQVQSSPLFQQDVRVNVSARVGDKLKFNIDQNTKNIFGYDSKFKIGYEGYEDDIIKKVEVGNIAFETGSTLIQGGSELFGVGATLQFGPLFLKLAVSQKKGQKKFMDLTGGTSKTYFNIHAWNYARNHYFLDTAYKQVYDEYYSNSTPVLSKNSSHLRIKQIQVWEASTELTNPHVAQAIAVADLPGKRRKMNEDWDDSIRKAAVQTGVVEKGRFALLDSNQYVIDYNLGTLTLRNFREDRYYAVSYRTEGATTDTTDDVYYGYFSNQIGLNDTLLLKLIYRPNLLPAYKTLWSRQMKNTYNIGSQNINLSETNISVWYTRKSNDSTDMLEGANDKLVTVLGVDRVTNSTGAEPPDGIFDITTSAFFNAERGEITFPHSEPFAKGLEDYFEKIGNKELASMYVYRQIYDTTVEVAKKNTAKDRFIICGEMTGRQSNTINLQAYGLTPGSVKVTLDGRVLREYYDYTIEYATGRLTITDPRASMPNADLRIEYEQKDVFTTSTKTFFGLRADYELYKNRYMSATLGATAVRYSQAKLSDRARLGDEPIANTMFGCDIRVNTDAPWLTELLDMLPFYDTKAPSSISFFGEWAMVSPTPNRINSEITSDRNQPVAEIDNFESVTRTTSLSTSYQEWHHSSSPVAPEVFEVDPETPEVEQGKIAQNYRGRMWWWQYSYARVSPKDPYPDNQYYSGGTQSNINALYINFDPTHRGIYNGNPEYLDDVNPEFNSTDAFWEKNENREKIWGGMQRMLHTSSVNFDNDNVEFLDVMMLVRSRGPRTRVFIDIGMISEDVISNGFGDTEDGITEANPIPNGIIDAGEDVGIDGKSNEQEKEYYPLPLNLEDDPARDDFKFDFYKDDLQRDDYDYIAINNFEGNANYDMGMYPDKEMLNMNNSQTLSTDNQYFTYEIKIDGDPRLNPQIVGGNPDKGWFQYRIPIRKPSGKVGNPQFSNMPYVRFRVQGDGFQAIIADWKLIGNYWQRSENFEDNYNPNDSVLSVSYVNVWENSKAPDYYEMPPGVQAPRQLGTLDYSVDSRLNEQSLSVGVKNLLWGEERMAVKVFYDQDFFNYKKLKYFIHGDGSMPYDLNSLASAKPKAYSFIRFGIDSGNYYEYRRPITQGWQEVEINLADLTAIKQVRDTMMLSERVTFPVPNDPSAHFAIKGNPILTKVKFVGLGIANPSDAFQELTTTMWVDELRLLSPESSNDWAGLATFSTNLADLGTVNLAFNNMEPNFHKMEERYGNRSQTREWSAAFTGNLEKFAPKSFTQMKVPIAYSHIEKMENPKYVASNDIELAAAANAAYNKVISEGGSAEAANAAANDVRLKSSTLSVQDGWSLAGVKLGIPVKHWSIAETINRITTSYSYSQIFERSPIYAERFSWIWRLGLNYTLPLPELVIVKPLAWLGTSSSDNSSTIKPDNKRPQTKNPTASKSSSEIPVIGVYKDWKLNLLPSNIALTLDMQRRRQTEQTRQIEQPSPVVREFMANRGATINWKLSQGGFLNPTIDYSFRTTSTLVPFELDPVGRQRTGSELANMLFFQNNRLFEFGFNNNHQQSVSLNFKPILPNIIGLNKVFEITGGYTSNYLWKDPLQQDPSLRDAAKSASVNSSFKFTTNIKFKELGNYIFGGPTKTAFAADKKTKDTNTTSTANNVLKSIANIFQVVIFNWDQISMNYNLTNAAVNPGVFGGSGMDNFWGRGMTFRSSQLSRGPSFAYQMGFVSSPHSTWNVTSSDRFPFFGFETNYGLRPPNSVFQDNFNQVNGLDIKTSRELWEGAKLDLNWKMALTYNRNMTIETDSLGFATPSNAIIQDNLNRTFLAIPNFFGLNLFGNPIETIVSIFDAKKTLIDEQAIDSLSKNEAIHRALSEAFYDGLEAFSFTGGQVGKVLPAVNWTFRWDGLEKWKMWQGYVKRLSVEHNYTSTYVEIGQTTDLGRNIQTQTMQSGFNPLFGVTASFDEKLLNGVLTASIKWSETSNYSATTASGAIISLQRTTDITANASYTLKSFTMPILGLTTKNDLEVSLLFTFKKNNTGTFDVLDPKSYNGNNATSGRTLQGNTQIILEPRAKYTLSQLVTASFFIRYEGTFNEGAANPGYHNIQVGLDFIMNISGGR